MPDTDPIASTIGHGTLGLRSNLRPLTELIRESASQKHVYVECRPSQVVTGWTAYSGSAYQATVNVEFDGVQLDVVGMRVVAEILTRVEDPAAVVATAGTFHYAQATNTLYARLTSGSDPDSTTAVAQFGIYFSNVPIVQPGLGRQGLTDGGLEAWISATNATNWTEADIGAGGGSINQRTVSGDGVGTYAAGFLGAFNAAGGKKINQVVSAGLTGNPMCVFAGWYWTPGGAGVARNPSSVGAQISVQVGSTYLTSDGRETSASETWHALTDTNGEWRRFAFYFKVPSASTITVHVGAYNSGTALAGSTTTDAARFDGLVFHWVPRWNRHLPILPLEGVPTIESARGDVWFGPWSTGLGNLTLANAGGYLEALFSTTSLDWLGADVFIRIGGRFPGGGNEVTFEATREHYYAQVTGLEATTESAVLTLADYNGTNFRTSLPARTYTTGEFANLAEHEKGRTRPLVFAWRTQTNMRPALVNTSGFGTFEVFDAARGPGGAYWTLVSPDNPVLYSYVDEEAADKQDATRRITATQLLTPHFTPDGNTGQIEITWNVIPFVVTEDNNRLDFDIGGAALVAQVAPGVYEIGYGKHTGAGSDERGLGLAVKNAMNTAAAVSNMGMEYNATTNKVTIKRTSGTLNLRVNTGVNAHLGIWGLLGFDTGADKTGASSYAGDNALWETPLHLVLRANANGLRDDAAGTYTGTADAPIVLAGDIIYCILRHFLGVPLSFIDTASFVAARTTAPVYMSVYLGAQGEDQVELWELIHRLEESCFHDLVLDGRTFYFRERTTSTPANVLDLYDRDFLSFSSWLDYDAIRSKAVVQYGLNPSAGTWATVEASDSATETRYRLGANATMQRTWTTYYPVSSPPTAGLWHAQAGSLKRRFRFSVKGSCLVKLVTDKVRLNRTDRLVGTSPVVVRITRKLDNLQTWVSDIEAIEV